MSSDTVPAKAHSGQPPKRSRAGRPASPLITRRTAAETALRVIDADGLDALSLQAVARQMGVAAPSLYYHFKDKDELLAEVALCLLREVGTEQDSWSENWEERTIELAVATRRVALRHPNAAPLSLRFFPRRLILPAYEQTLSRCPYPTKTHLIVLEVIEKFTYGSSLFAAAAEAYRSPAMPPIDARRFPHLARAVEAQPDEETIFVEALKAILEGLRHRFATPPGKAGSVAKRLQRNSS